jgi:hypothetical protein
MKGNKFDARSVINKDKHFEINARKIHGDKYIYHGGYTKRTENVSIECPDHGVFAQLANNHLCGHGCPKCDGTKQGAYYEIFKTNPNLELYIYFVRCWNDEEKFHKIGLSNKPNRRMGKIPYNTEILCTTFGKLGDLFRYEQKKVAELRVKYSYKPLQHFAGHTECFKIV